VPELIVALDQIALLRESRHSREPDPAAAGLLAELAGADALSVGLRTDRRHAQERDLKVLRATCRTRLQVRVPPTPESIKIIAPIRPDAVVLVPERSDLIAHESGFDLTVGGGSLADAATALREAGLPVSVLIEPDREQVKAAHRLGFAGVSLTGARAGGAQLRETVSRELESVEDSLRLAAKLGLSAQLGHCLDLPTLTWLARVPGLEAVEVGHAIVARAVLVGMERAVADFRAALAGRAR
jgi:pyridoxine 5-phosphate synthase